MSPTLPTFFGYPAQFDLGNFTAGAATAFLALVSLGIALFSHDRQKRQKIAEFRKEWNEAFRTKCAELMALQTAIQVNENLRQHAGDAETYDVESKLNQEYKALVLQLYSTKAYLLLMLNPNETSHALIERKLDEITDLAIAPNLEEKEKIRKSSDLPKFHELARSILKSEWRRVKSGG